MNFTLNFGQLPNWMSAAMIGAYVAVHLAGRWPVPTPTAPTVTIDDCRQICDGRIEKYGPHECACAWVKP